MKFSGVRVVLVLLAVLNVSLALVVPLWRNAAMAARYTAWVTKEAELIESGELVVQPEIRKSSAPSQADAGWLWHQLGPVSEAQKQRDSWASQIFLLVQAAVLLIAVWFVPSRSDKTAVGVSAGS